MKDLIEKAEEFAEEYCKKDPEDKKLWENHVRLGRKFSLELAEKEKADKGVVEIAALLHDIGKYKGRKDHHIRSYQLAKEFLKDKKVSQHRKDLILKCVFKHRSKFSKEENEIEVKIIQSADVLATLFDEEWQKQSMKTLSKQQILESYDKSFRKINLESARKIARKQIKKLKNTLHNKIPK